MIEKKAQEDIEELKEAGKNPEVEGKDGKEPDYLSVEQDGEDGVENE